MSIFVAFGYNIDVLCLVYSNLCTNKQRIKYHYQSYPKSTKIDAFEQKKKNIYRNPNDNHRILLVVIKRQIIFCMNEVLKLFLIMKEVSYES